MPAPSNYYSILTAAVNDMAEHGFDSVERVKYWQDQLQAAAQDTILSDAQMEAMLRGGIRAIYLRLVDRGTLLQRHPGISRFTLERLRPHLHSELDRRIMASADLIKLNRKQSVEQTLRRFAGWSTSLPPGGTAQVDRIKQKQVIRKSLAQLPFEARRVLIDQGHKLTSAINSVVARDGGAIAGRWHSHWRQANYNFRPDHKERDGLVYAVRGSWALAGGLMTAGAGYTDQITQPAEEPFCRCAYTYLYHLRQLPPDMLTKKGQSELERARAIVEAS
jgi:hypothetical protein